MRFSVVIPCFNVEAYIRPCLGSVMEQTHPVAETIVVDDGSTDNTIATVGSMIAAYPGRIRLIRAAHAGACAARNRGLREATGAWVQFLDADDRLLPEKIAGQVALVGTHPEAVAIIGDHVKEMPDGQTEEVRALHGEAWQGLIKTMLGTTSANLWRREALDAVSGWDEKLGSSQDYELLFRLMKVGGKLAFDPVPNTIVVKRAAGSISQSALKENWLRYIALRLAIRDHLRAQGAVAFATELTELDQYLFMVIHVIAQDDLDLASKLYRRHLPKDFVPQRSRAITARYLAAHRLLGFEQAVRLGRLIKR